MTPTSQVKRISTADRLRPPIDRDPPGHGHFHDAGRALRNVNVKREAAPLRRPLDTEPSERRGEPSFCRGESRQMRCNLPRPSLGRGNREPKDVVRERRRRPRAPAVRVARVCGVVVVSSVAAIPGSRVRQLVDDLWGSREGKDGGRTRESRWR